MGKIITYKIARLYTKNFFNLLILTTYINDNTSKTIIKVLNFNQYLFLTILINSIIIKTKVKIFTNNDMI